MYVCGPTVYGPDHIGHARTWVIFDWFRRYLIFSGFKVKFVQNITDVGHLVGDREVGEDKIEKEAKAKAKTPAEISAYYIDEHFKDIKSLNILKPDFSPKATEYIRDIIAYIKVLIDKGFAYEKNGSVYFDVLKFPDYGKLSGRSLEKLKTGTRLEENPDKKDAFDFALWIKAGEDHLQKWPSPWGQGYPGWHIECSVMSAKLLGQPFDIHGSAVEHIFPHHENEIAQGEAYAGKALANYWLHSGMLDINGTKMSKSKENYITIKDMLKEMDADTIKVAFMATYWSKPYDYTKDAIMEAKKIKSKLVSAKDIAKEGKTDFAEKLKIILDDNFNTPGALTLILQKLPNLKKDDYNIVEEIFGLELKSEKIKLTKDQEEMLNNREKARKEGDFAKADEIRKKLAQEGINIKDTEKGQEVLTL